MTNVYWDIKRWWAYWIEVQEKAGILRDEGTAAASSAFDVKKIRSSETRKIGGYIASYLSRSDDAFDCRVWHCSKGVSRLYTAFYSGPAFLDTSKSWKPKTSWVERSPPLKKNTGPSCFIRLTVSRPNSITASTRKTKPSGRTTVPKMSTNLINRLPRMKHTKVHEVERADLFKEMSEADTILTFYRTPKGEDRCVYSGLCLDLFMLLVVLLNRNIIISDFMKTVFQTIDKMRDEEDLNKHVLEAVNYLKINPPKTNKSHELF